MYRIKLADAFENNPTWYKKYCEYAGIHKPDNRTHEEHVSLYLFEKYEARFIIEHGRYEDLKNITTDDRVNEVEFQSVEDATAFILTWI